LDMSISWKLVDTTAEEMGVKVETRRKWRQRGLPPAWQLSIAQHLMRRGYPVSLDDFAKLELRPGRIDA
jgi:hypothetical protein